VNEGLQHLAALDRSNLATEIAAQLRDAIANGDILPGTRLVEVRVSKQLGVSRGPVREALRILETEGLVKSYPGRGSFVSEISERDIWEIYSLRTVLEEEAIRLAAQRGTPEDVDRLERIMEAMFKAADAGDRAQVLDLDLQFHRQIWEMADHQRLKNILTEIATQVRTYVALQTKLYDDLVGGISDHQELLEALRNRDEVNATNTMRNHLEVAARTVLDYCRRVKANTVETEPVTS